jgi:hypothetical protein
VSRLSLIVTALVTVAVVGATPVALGGASAASKRLSLKIVSVTEVPFGKAPLAAGKINVVRATRHLGFRIKLRNTSSRHQWPGVVTLSIKQVRPYQEAIVVDPIASIAPHETVSVTVRNVGPLAFGTRLTLKVTLTRGSAATAHAVSYPVIVTLP